MNVRVPTVKSVQSRAHSTHVNIVIITLICYIRFLCFAMEIKVVFIFPLLLLVTVYVSAIDPNIIKSGPPPNYKHSAFRLIVPQNALITLHWHDALRHAAFLALRRSINSYDGNAQKAEMALWQRLHLAPVTPFDLAKPIHEDKDIMTLASGVLVRDGGRLEFLPEASVLDEGNPRKVSALWTVLRVRHSGPGLSSPRIEYYFTIQPAAHMSILNHAEKQQHKIVFTKTIPKPISTYKDVPNSIPKIPNVSTIPADISTLNPNFIDTNIPNTIHNKVPNIVVSNVPNPIPIYSNAPGQFYDPEFLTFYRNAISKYIQKQHEGQNLLKVNEALSARKPNDPIYILPSPRLVQPPTFPRLSQLLPQSEAPKLVNIVVPKQHQGNYVRFYDTQESRNVNNRKRFEPRSDSYEPEAKNLTSSDDSSNKRFIKIKIIEQDSASSRSR